MFDLVRGRHRDVAFSTAQCEAVVRYLRWYVAETDMAMPEVERALETHWLPRCGPGRDR